MVSPGTEVIVKGTGEVVTVGEAPMVTLTEMSIQNIAHNVTMAEKLVTTLLEREIDYGRTPGTPIDGLWDAGAAKIMAGFNCYVDHQILFHTDEENLISWCIQAKIISRASQTVVGTGVGAASTREVKYKYRWVDNPREYGYGDDEIEKLKRKESKYRITNPEYGELVNTLFLMAAKRSEVDGARSMPGVGGALKKLFENKMRGESQSQTRKPNDWTPFWGETNRMGLTPEKAREYLGVKSMKEYKGTIEEALATIRGKVAQDAAPPQPRRESKDIPKRTELEFLITLDLLRICSEDFRLSSSEVFKELGYPNQKTYEEACTGNHFQSYLQIKATQGQQPGEEVEPDDIPF